MSEAELKKVLVEAAIPLEVLAAQINLKPYTEMTLELQNQIIDVVRKIREAIKS
jgi:type VI protein secretion system component VasF